MDCLFCALARHEIPTQIMWEDEDFIVFPDLHPQAKIHWLIVPKHHAPDLLALSKEAEGQRLLERFFKLLPTWTDLAGVTQSGFRLVNNCGRDGGQTIGHVHVHLLGGEALDP